MLGTKVTLFNVQNLPVKEVILLDRVSHDYNLLFF